MGNPVRYAEDKLGVHTLWEEHAAKLEEYKRASATLVECQHALRDVKDQQDDYELDIAINLRAGEPGLSQAALARELKEALHGDPEAKAHREEVRIAQNRLDGAERHTRVVAAELQGMNARLTELGGLLNFYAATNKRTP